MSHKVLPVKGLHSNRLLFPCFLFVHVCLCMWESVKVCECECVWVYVWICKCDCVWERDRMCVCECICMSVHMELALFSIKNTGVAPSSTTHRQRVAPNSANLAKYLQTGLTGWRSVVLSKGLLTTLCKWTKNMVFFKSKVIFLFLLYRAKGRMGDTDNLNLRSSGQQYYAVLIHSEARLWCCKSRILMFIVSSGHLRKECA